MLMDWQGSHGPALAANASGALSLLMRAADGPLWAFDHTNSIWQARGTVPGAKPQTAPAAAYLNNQLHVMYLR
ncbi:hypothetical protein [Streptomyces goshikiensis]